MNYFPNYYSIDDIFVTQEKVECKVNTRLQRMGKQQQLDAKLVHQAPLTTLPVSPQAFWMPAQKRNI